MLRLRDVTVPVDCLEGPELLDLISKALSGEHPVVADAFFSFEFRGLPLGFFFLLFLLASFFFFHVAFASLHSGCGRFASDANT